MHNLKPEMAVKNATLEQKRNIMRLARRLRIPVNSTSWRSVMESKNEVHAEANPHIGWTEDTAGKYNICRGGTSLSNAEFVPYEVFMARMQTITCQI